MHQESTSCCWPSTAANLWPEDQSNQGSKHQHNNATTASHSCTVQRLQPSLLLLTDVDPSPAPLAIVVAHCNESLLLAIANLKATTSSNTGPSCCPLLRCCRCCLLLLLLLRGGKGLQNRLPGDQKPLPNLQSHQEEQGSLPAKKTRLETRMEEDVCATPLADTRRSSP